MFRVLRSLAAGSWNTSGVYIFLVAELRECGREHADHVVRRAVDDDVSPDDRGIAAELRPPHGVREHRHVRVAGPRIRRLDGAADRGRYTEHREPIATDLQPVDALGVAADAHVETRIQNRAQAGEHAARLPLHEVGDRGWHLAEVAGGEFSPHEDDARRISDADRRKHGLRQAVDRRVRTDAGGQDGRDHHDEPWRFPDHAYCVAEVLQRRLDERNTPGVANRVRRHLQAASREQRLPARFVARHAGPHVVVDLHREMRAELFGEAPVLPTAADDACDAHEEAADGRHQASAPGLRKRARISVVRSHCSASRARCFRPDRVIA